MSLVNPGYIPRLVDAKLAEMVGTFGAVQVDGPKWCGKTWTSRTIAESQVNLDDAEIAPVLDADLSFALAGAKPHLIDEWQLYPRVRDLVRRAVDESGSLPGQFILTGSTRGKPRVDVGGTGANGGASARGLGYSHSGAGRIARLVMGTMTMREAGLSDGSVSIGALFEGNPVEPAPQAGSLATYAEWLCRGGWPATLGLDAKRAQAYPRSYLDALVEEDARAAGYDSAMMRSLIRSLARNEGTSAALKTIVADVAGASGGATSVDTVRRYLDYVESAYLVSELRGWAPPIKARERVRVKPKRYFCDPSLAIAALGLGPERLLREGQLLGSLFESLCVHDVGVYLGAMESSTAATLRYYRDEKGNEVDLVIELADGRWGAIECKLSHSAVPSAERNLLRLRDLVAKNPAMQEPEPSFLMVLVSVAPMVYTTKAGVIVAPLTALSA